MKWLILVIWLNGQTELDGRFDTKLDCEIFASIVTSIYLDRFEKVEVMCKRENEEEV
jgi:hypothetical protein